MLDQLRAWPILHNHHELARKGNKNTHRRSKVASKVLVVQPFCDSEGKAEAGLCIGMNYVGVLQEPHFSKLQDIFAPQMEPKWYLDEELWRWERKGKFCPFLNVDRRSSNDSYFSEASTAEAARSPASHQLSGCCLVITCSISWRFR